MPLIDLNGLGYFKDKENAMVAADYSASNTYAVGDYVYYNGTLYRCTTAITTAEAWTAGHWTAAKLAEDLTSQSGKIDELKAAIDQDVKGTGSNIIELTDFTEDKTVTHSVSDDAITVTTTASKAYACAQTANTFIANNLAVGRSYRLHVKAEKISGTPNIHVGIRGVNGGEDTFSQQISLNDGGEGFFDFVADSYQKRVTLMVTYSTATTASVKFSELYIVPYSTTVSDVDVANLKSKVGKLTEDPSFSLMKKLRTYSDGSVSAGNREFTVFENTVSVERTGSNSSTYYNINLTGSSLVARSGSKDQFAVYDTDFVSSALLNAAKPSAPAINNFHTYLRRVPILEPTESAAGYFFVVTKDSNGNVDKGTGINNYTRGTTLVDLNAIVGDKPYFAIYAGTNSNAASKNYSFYVDLVLLPASPEIASEERTSTASKAYSANEYLVKNDTLYRVTTDIESGGTITVGTNIVATSVGNELTSLSDSSYSFALDDGTAAIIQDYAAQLKSAGDCDSFMFFTDSHILGGSNWQKTFYKAFQKMQKVYNTAPVDFCIYGGDALTGTSPYTTQITANMAMYYLTYQDKVSREIFGHDRYLPMLGNHDYNYQASALLTEQQLANAWFRNKGKAYYDYQAFNSKIYVLNTGLNRTDSGTGGYDVPMDDYKWGQIDWLAGKLAEDDADHSIIALHIIKNNSTLAFFSLYVNANDLCAAYNSHTTITLNSITYDFTGCTGRVELFLGGHLHSDSYYGIEDGIPYITRANTLNGDVNPTFDLVLCDWDNRTVLFKRIGNGSDLTIDLDTGEPVT